MMAAVTKKLLPVALVIACLVVMVWGLLRANAAWHYIAAQAIAEPLFAASGGDAAAFEQSQRHIGTALRRLPSNPDYHDFSGRLLILKASQPGVVGVERRDLLESAAVHFRQSLSVRRLWPYSWVNLLSVKDKLGQVDIEFNHALRRSAETGPWEPWVQLQLIDSGLRHWSSLGRAEQTLVRHQVSSALKVRPRQVFAVIKNYGRPDLICGNESGYKQISRWCESTM
jgi:hypothetical protein